MIRATALLATVIPCVMLGVSAWLLYWTYLERGQDWMVFDTAARVYFDGDLLVVLEPSRFMTALNNHFETWLMKPPLSLHPWVYPPHFLTLFLPFGILSPMLSYVSFMLFTFSGRHLLCNPGTGSLGYGLRSLPCRRLPHLQ